VIGYDDRPPTTAELEQMKKLVAGAMKDGALGVSTSLQYVPARFARTDEVVELAKIAHQYGGIYITHQRSEANAIDESMKEVFEIARRSQIFRRKSGTSKPLTRKTGAACQRCWIASRPPDDKD